MVPTLIASFYGMNVPLPAQENAYTSVYIIAGSVVLSLLVTWYFQRKRLF
jgi:magnesium transporter